MNLVQLKVTNFKTFADQTINFADITVLAGANSVGKSSTIQALLLLRSVVEKIFSKQLVANDGKVEIPLNGPYMLSLGCTKEVITWEMGKSFSVTLVGESNQAHEITDFSFEAKDLEETNYFIAANFPRLDQKALNLISGDFYYLNAERLGPRIRHWVNENPSVINCGHQGQYSIEVLARLGDEIGLVSETKFLRGEKLTGQQTLARYTKQWLDYIVPGTDISNAEIFGNIRSASVKFNSFFSPPNVGFGISYILPIIITGLIAKEKSLIIIENPEAHLHPKGQSRMGFFLASMANAGLQIVVETHSEHIINGIRLASVEEKVNPDKFSLINFYNKDNDQVKIDEIRINAYGDLSDFPYDFFDQSQQDLLAMMKLSRE